VTAGDEKKRAKEEKLLLAARYRITRSRETARRYADRKRTETTKNQTEKIKL